MKEYSHDELSVKAGAWLHSKTTFSGVRSDFEISLSQGYVADYVALAWLQCRFMERYQMGGSQWAVNEDNVMVPARHVLPSSFVFVFESKATRSDFLSTFNGTDHHENRKEAIGSLHWCVANKGVCDPVELPDFWGLLLPSGRGLTEIRNPTYNAIEQAFVNKVANTLLWKKPYCRFDAVLRGMAEAKEEPHD